VVWAGAGDLRASIGYAGGGGKGGELVFVDESDPAYSLEQVSVATGTLRSLGYFTQGALQSGNSGLYAFSADDVVVNSTGDSTNQPPVAAIKAPSAQG
jgi:hypothetical protein